MNTKVIIGYILAILSFIVGISVKNKLKKGEVNQFIGWIVVVVMMVVGSGLTYISTFQPEAIFAADSGYNSPSATGDDYNSWSNSANAYTSNNSYAFNDGDYGGGDEFQDWYNYSFGITAGATIDGIEVSVEWKGSNAFLNTTANVALSYNGGTTYTTNKAIGVRSTSDEIDVVGGSADDWGRSWTDTEFSDANFRVRLEATSFFDAYVDHIQIKVYYTEAVGGEKTPKQSEYWFD